MSQGSTSSSQTPSSGVRNPAAAVSERSPAVTAWSIGRLLNHLHFVLQQAWLLPSRDQASLADSLWTDLALAVRGLFSSPGEVDERFQQVLDEHRRWGDAFGNLSHHELVESEYAELERRQYVDSGQSSRSLRDETCRNLLHPVRETVETLHEIIERGFDERFVRLLRLAEAVDRGVHPTDEYGHFFESRNAVPQGEDVEESETERNVDVWAGGVHVAAIPPERPTVATPTAERDDPATWLREIQERWIEIGLPSESLPDSVVENELPSPNESTRRTDCGPIACAVDEAARAVAAAVVHPAGEPTPGFLGLILNPSNREVRRVGYDVTVTIQGPVRWGVLDYLVRRQRNFTPRRELLCRWEEFAGSPDVDVSRVDGVMRDLRRSLRRLGLVIQNQRDSGWRINDSSPDAQAGPANIR